MCQDWATIDNFCLDFVTRSAEWGGGRNITNEQKCGQQLENWNGWNPSCLFIVLNGTIPEKRKMEKKISTHINKYWEGR